MNVAPIMRACFGVQVLTLPMLVESPGGKPTFVGTDCDLMGGTELSGSIRFGARWSSASIQVMAIYPGIPSCHC